MSRLELPNWVIEHKKHEYARLEDVPAGVVDRIAAGLQRFANVESPVVSIVIPAYNEQKHILKTLSSFAAMHSDYATELILVDNNSSDATVSLAQQCGVRVVPQPIQGISHARQMGLEVGRGTYFLNADADSIYPQDWINEYVRILQNEKIACAYGRYSFMPDNPTHKRSNLAIYEFFAETYFNIRRLDKEFLNVMGFNFAFRRDDGLRVGGFNTTRPKWSDGWMGMQLQALGKIYYSKTDKTRVWTSDRRIRADGSLAKAFFNRVKKTLPLNSQIK